MKAFITYNWVVFVWLFNCVLNLLMESYNGAWLSFMLALVYIQVGYLQKRLKNHVELHHKN
jgi:hypothetical protein